MFYKEAIEYMRNIESAGSDYGIERMRELLLLLDNPQESLKIVHIAGTNGKGSVSAYLTSVFKCAGLKVGTYNSPSVFGYNERWLIDGKPLDDESVAKYISIVRQTIENEQKLRAAFGLESFMPTAFEIETAVAVLAFYDKSCDVCVLETGLGGRWDATNAIEDKELAVITPIGFDHCALLGDTLSEIAAEKAAIIRDKAVTCAQSDEVMQELKRPYRLVDDKREYYDADIIVCGRPKSVSFDLSGQSFEYDGETYRIKMLGDYQLTNAAIAICAVKTLREMHWDISQQALKDGLANAVWHGRFEVVSDAKARFNLSIPNDKILVLDGAHNPHGAKALRASIEKYLDGKRVEIVLGILADKDIDGIVRELCLAARRIIVVTPPSARALDSAALKRVIDDINTVDRRNIECVCAQGVREGVELALQDECDAVIVCGSLTLFGALKQ